MMSSPYDMRISLDNKAPEFVDVIDKISKAKFK